MIGIGDAPQTAKFCVVCSLTFTCILICKQIIKKDCCCSSKALCVEGVMLFTICHQTKCRSKLIELLVPQDMQTTPEKV